MKGKYTVTFVALFACSLLIAPIAARADTNLGLQISSGAVTETLCDNNVDFTGCTHNANDVNGASGGVQFVGSVDKWTMNSDAGLGPPFENLKPLLDIAYSQAQTTGGESPVSVTLSVIGLNSPTFPIGLLQALQKLNGNGENNTTTTTLQAWLDPTNHVFCGASCGTAIPLTSLLSFTSDSYAGKSTGMANSGSGPYSITLTLTIDAMGLAETETGDAQLDIPEPATLSVLGAALLGLGTGIRRKLTKV